VLVGISNPDVNIRFIKKLAIINKTDIKFY